MFITLVLLVGLLSIWVLTNKLRRSEKKRRYLSEFPGSYPWPIIGNSLQLGFDSDESSPKLLALWRKYGSSNFRMSVGSEDWVVLTEPDDVGLILSHPTELRKPKERNDAIMPFFGNSVSTSEGERWRSTRKLLTPSFHVKAIEQKLDAVDKYCDHLLNYMSTDSDNGPLDLYTYLRPFMYDVLCGTLLGVNTNLMEKPDHPYLKASGRVSYMITMLYFSHWRHISFLHQLTPTYREIQNIIKTIRRMSSNIISERKEKLNALKEDIKKNNKNKNIDFQEIFEDRLKEDASLLDNLIFSKMQNGSFTPTEMIIEEISLISYTGHYTTTMTMSHTLYCLAKYPEIQQKVVEELNIIYRKDKHRKTTDEDLKNMKYLDAVIKESIRVIPTVPKIGRQLKEDLIMKDGRQIPAEASVVIFLEAMYQNECIFPNPDKYDPDRFLGTLDSFVFLPFSAGPRNCIGSRYSWMVMKLVIANILRKFEVTSCGREFEPQFKYRIITESVNGVKLLFKHRHL